MEKTIILDLGAGNNTKNDPSIIKKMIDEIYLLQHQTKKKILIKFQLFENIKNLIALNKKLYCFAYYYAQTLGLSVFASIFDKNSLHFLETFFIDTPLKPREHFYIKIACRKHLYRLIKYISENVTIFVSVDSCETRDRLKKMYPNHKLIFLYCVSSYPAFDIEYEGRFQGLDDSGNLNYSISDHTVGLGMFKRFEPLFWEKHFILDKDDCTDPFGCDFCITAKEMELIL